MSTRSRLAALLFTSALAAGAWAVEWSVDETTNRKQLEAWLKDPDQAHRLQRNALAFRSLPHDVQDRLRELDKSLAEMDPAKRAHLLEVMERHAGWLGRLSSEERKRVNAASVGPERAQVIKEIIEQEWQESLPKPDRDKLASLDAEGKTHYLDQLRTEEEARRKLRADAHRIAEEETLLGALNFGQQDFRDRVQAAEESLRPLLNKDEEARLINSKGNRHAFVIAELSDGKLPIPFPGPAPAGKSKAIKSWKEVPQEIAKKFPVGDPPATIAKAEGKWPELPMAVVEYAHDHKIEIDTSLLGPTRAEELPPHAKKFVQEELQSKLSEAEKQQLLAAEHKWPDYPKKVKELADRHRPLRVPGLSLPGDPEAWRRLRNSRPGRMMGKTEAS
ncbi:MAG: hypothetical protein ACJ8C4_05565 [Gemmataceae bacterium]